MDGLVDVVAEKGALTYAGETLGLGKTGDVNVNWAGRNALKEIGFLLEEHPELAKEVPKEINLLLKGQAYEGIFEELRKAHEVAPKPWQMTREEFLANPPEEVDIWLVEGKPPHRGKIGSTPDFFGGPPTRGYRVANTVTPFDIAHKNIVKHALEEGKPVPPEVLADYPEVAPKAELPSSKSWGAISKVEDAIGKLSAFGGIETRENLVKAIKEEPDVAKIISDEAQTYYSEEVTLYRIRKEGWEEQPFLSYTEDKDRWIKVFGEERVVTEIIPRSRIFATWRQKGLTGDILRGRGEKEVIVRGIPTDIKNVWQMTRKEFTNIEKGVVELLPIPPGRWERAVIHPSPKKKGYMQWSLIELNPKTGVWEPGSDIQFPDKQALRRHLEVIHKQEVKQAIREGKPVPQEILRDYPDLTKKLTTEHVV